MSPHFPPTMTRSSQFFRRAGLAVLIGLGVSAADAQPRGLDARLDRLTDGLTLSTQQSASLDALATEYAEADRADLWAAAAEVSAVLTDAQIDQLQQARTARRSERGARSGEGRQGRRGDRATRGDRQDRTAREGRQERGSRQGRADRPTLTDEQRDALRAIRSDVRAQAEALADQLRDGAISDEAFLAQTRALREEGVRRSAEVLPADVAAERAERQASRDAAQAAREQALGLTAAQKQQMEARRLDRVRNAPEPLDMRPYLDADGRLDRQAFREAQRAQRETMREARGERDDVLTEDQKDIAFVYSALAGGRDGQGRRGRGHRGGRGR